MVCIGANDPAKVSELWFDLIETDYLKEFHDVVQLPEAYGGIIDRFAEQTGQIANGLLLKKYINERLNLIKSITENAQHPSVYYAMGYPLFALNAERFETNLVQAAGGTCLNKQLTRKGKPGITISKEEFMELNPEIIFISGFLSCPASDFYEYCIKHDLMVDAVKNNQIYDHFPLWDFGSPRWILGLMHIANAQLATQTSMECDAPVREQKKGPRLPGTHKLFLLSSTRIRQDSRTNSKRLRFEVAATR